MEIGTSNTKNGTMFREFDMITLTYTCRGGHTHSHTRTVCVCVCLCVSVRVCVCLCVCVGSPTPKNIDIGVAKNTQKLDKKHPKNMRGFSV